MSEHQKPKQMVQNISCVLSQTNQLGALYVGNIYGAQNGPILKQYGIRAVISLSTESDVRYSPSDIPYHLVIHAHDKDDYSIVQHLQECIQFIDTRRKLTNVYVHCFAGVSRSVTVCIAYLMRTYRWDLNKALNFIKYKRVVSKPNDGFLMQLKRFEQHEFSEQTLKAKTEGPELSQFINSTRYVNDLAWNSSSRIIKTQQRLITPNKQYFSPDNKQQYYPSGFPEESKQVSRLVLLQGNNLPPQNTSTRSSIPIEGLKFAQTTVPNTNRSSYYITNKSKLSDSKRNNIRNSFNFSKQIQSQRRSIHNLSPFKGSKDPNQASKSKKLSSVSGIVYQPRLLNQSSTKSKHISSSLNSNHILNAGYSNQAVQLKRDDNPFLMQNSNVLMGQSQRIHQLNNTFKSNPINQIFLAENYSPRHVNKIYPQSSIYLSKSNTEGLGQTNNDFNVSQTVHSVDPYSNALSRKKQIQISSNSRISYKHDIIPIPKISTRRDKGIQSNGKSSLNLNQQDQLRSAIRELQSNREKLNKNNIHDYYEQKKSKSRIVRPKDLPGYKRY